MSHGWKRKFEDRSDFRFPVPQVVSDEVKELGEGEVFLDYLLVDSGNSEDEGTKTIAVMNTLDRFLNKRPRDSGLSLETVAKPPPADPILLDSTSSSSSDEELSSLKKDYSLKLRDVDSSVGQQKRMSLKSKQQTPTRVEPERRPSDGEDSPFEMTVESPSRFEVSQKRNASTRESCVSSSSSSSSSSGEEKESSKPALGDPPVQQDSDVESIYSIDIFSQREAVKAEQNSKEDEPPQASESPPPTTRSPPPPRKSAGQRNILDYVRKKPSSEVHEVSPSTSDDGGGTKVVGRKSSVGESTSLETWYRGIKEKNNNVLDSIRFDDPTDAQVFYEDFGQDDEIFVVQCPKEMDVTMLEGKEFQLDGESVFSLKMKNGSVEKYESVGCRELNRVANLILPSRETKKFKLASIPLSGSIMISEGVDIPEVVLEEEASFERIPLPEGLHERHPTYGLDKPPQPESSPEKPKKKKKKRERDKDKVAEIETKDATDSIQNEDILSSVAEIQTKDATDSMQNKDILSSEIPSKVEDSLRKHKKKKHKERVAENETKDAADPMQNEDILSSETPSKVEDSPGKHKKKKHKERVPEIETNNATEVMQNEDILSSEISSKVEDSSRKHKKKKHKERVPEINVDQIQEDLLNGLVENLDAQNDPPKKKKKKKKHQESEGVEMSPVGEVSYGNNKEAATSIGEELREDLEETKPKKKKKRKNKDNEENQDGHTEDMSSSIQYNVEEEQLEDLEETKPKKKKKKKNKDEEPAVQSHVDVQTLQIYTEPKKKRKFAEIEEPQQSVEQASEISVQYELPKKKKKNEGLDDAKVEDTEMVTPVKKKKKKKKNLDFEGEVEGRPPPPSAEPEVEEATPSKKKKKKKKKKKGTDSGTEDIEQEQVLEPEGPKEEEEEIPKKKKKKKKKRRNSVPEDGATLNTFQEVGGGDEGDFKKKKRKERKIDCNGDG